MVNLKKASLPSQRQQQVAIRTRKPLTWWFGFFHYSLVFSTQLSLAAFNHHFIRVFIWITVAFISSTSAAQRKVCRAPRRLVYRGKVSHVLSGVSLQMMTVGSAEPQSPNESLMRGSQGEFGGVTAEAAAMLEDVSQKACRQETFKRQQKANSRKQFHSALIMRFFFLLFCSVLKVCKTWFETFGDLSGWHSGTWVSSGRFWIQFQHSLCVFISSTDWNIHFRLTENSLVPLDVCVSPGRIPASHLATLVRINAASQRADVGKYSREDILWHL